MTITNNDIKESLFVIGKNQITGEISRIAVPSDIQIGLKDKSAELQLLGRLSLNVTSYQINVEKTYDIDKDDCVSLIQKSDSYSGITIDLRMPSSPRNGQIHIIKDSSGTAADVNIVISTRNGSTFDGETSLTLSSAYSSTILFWNGNEWNVISSGGGGGGGEIHASTHIRGGSDQIDGDLIDIDFSPIYYTSSIAPTSTHIEHLASHLQGIDNILTTKASITHASTHIRSGSDQIDGDLIDIDFSPINYTSSIAPTSTHIEHLASHLKGIDDILITKASSSHAFSHILSGTDEINGDLIDIDYVPTNYSRTTSSVSTHVEHLSSHLNGIDQSLDNGKLIWEWNGFDTSQFETTSSLRNNMTSSDANFLTVVASSSTPWGNVLRLNATGSGVGNPHCIRLIKGTFPYRYKIEWEVKARAGDSVSAYGFFLLATLTGSSLSGYGFIAAQSKIGYRTDSNTSTLIANNVAVGSTNIIADNLQLSYLTINGNKRSGVPIKFIYQGITWRHVSESNSSDDEEIGTQAKFISEPAPSSWNNLDSNRIGISFRNVGLSGAGSGGATIIDYLGIRIYAI
jgi:hypothetical protein